MDGTRLSLQDVERMIKGFAPEDQAKLLSDLPRILALRRADRSLLELAEESFEFWDNPEDAAYDRL